MTKDEKKKHNCDNVNCNHNNAKGFCCMFNPDNCKYRQLQKENTELTRINDNLEKDRLAHIELEDKLTKENAELKGIKDVATLIRANNDTVVTLMQLNNMLVSKSQKLTKAKTYLKYSIEILKRLGVFKEQLVIEAEQFLKEE
ncbi:MAG: hypothetical protein K6G09_08305 [Treponema sp.]|nr:hypothetical protein [Treponema sp.]